MMELKDMSHKDLMDYLWGNFVIELARGEAKRYFYTIYNVIWNWIEVHPNLVK